MSKKKKKDDKAEEPKKRKKAEAKKSPAKAKAKPAGISSGDIALRAYFIAEHRQRHGLPGDEAGDWIEAERQLHKEAKKKK